MTVIEITFICCKRKTLNLFSYKKFFHKWLRMFLPQAFLSLFLFNLLEWRKSITLSKSFLKCSHFWLHSSSWLLTRWQTIVPNTWGQIILFNYRSKIIFNQNRVLKLFSIFQKLFNWIIHLIKKILIII